jgi:hypothetical protein
MYTSQNVRFGYYKIDLIRLKVWQPRPAQQFGEASTMVLVHRERHDLNAGRHFLLLNIDSRERWAGHSGHDMSDCLD